MLGMPNLVARGALLFLGLLFSVGISASIGAGQRSCRQCTCNFSANGSFNDIGLFMGYAKNKIAGGGEFSFPEEPRESANAVTRQPTIDGKVYFDRLCGNGKTANGRWEWPYSKDQGADTGIPAGLALTCIDCGKSVRCVDGSNCGSSGL